MKLVVDGMTCGHCVRTITGAIQRLEPGAQVAVDLDTSEVTIKGRITLAEAVKAIGDEGYPVVAILDTTSSPADEVSAPCCGTTRRDEAQSIS